MKTLDLDAYGVSEMNKQEMTETNGGFLFSSFAIMYIAGLIFGIALGIAIVEEVKSSNE